jgi:periplasmic divalent cation tolerance protein
MADYRIVFVTCENTAEAERIAEAVVAERLAACVNVTAGIRSCYIWEGRQTWSNEVLLIIKTTRARFNALEERIRALHSYTTPEIVAVPVVEGCKGYLDWIDQNTAQ